MRVLASIRAGTSRLPAPEEHASKKCAKQQEKKWLALALFASTAYFDGQTKGFAEWPAGECEPSGGHERTKEKGTHHQSGHSTKRQSLEIT